MFVFGGVVFLNLIFFTFFTVLVVFCVVLVVVVEVSFKYNFVSLDIMSLKGVLQVFFGILGIVLFFSGLYLFIVDFGFPGIVIPLIDGVFYLNPLGITFLVLGVVFLSVAFGEVFFCCD